MNFSPRVRRVLALLLVPVLVCLSSCLRVKQDVTIKSDQRINVVQDIGVLKTAASEGDTKITKDNICDDDAGSKSGVNTGDSLKLNDSKREPYEDDKYIGCRESGWVAPDQWRQNGVQVLTKSGDTWTFHMPGSSDPSTAKMAQIISDYKMSVTFPGKVLSHNGGSTVDGRTVTWTNPADAYSAEGLKATGSAKGGMPGWLLPLVLGLLVLGAGAAAWVILKKRKQQQAGQAPGAWGGPQPGGYPGDPNQMQYGQPGQQYGQYGATAAPEGQYGQQGPYGQASGQQWGQPDQGQNWGGQPAGGPTSQPTAPYTPEWDARSAASAPFPSSEPTAPAPEQWGQGGPGQPGNGQQPPNPWGPPQQGGWPQG